MAEPDPAVDPGWYPAVGVGETVRPGQLIGVVKDYFGSPVAEYAAPVAGMVLLVGTSLAIDPGDFLVGIGVP